jgi:urea transporter
MKTVLRVIADQIVAVQSWSHLAFVSACSIQAVGIGTAVDIGATVIASIMAGAIARFICDRRRRSRRLRSWLFAIRRCDEGHAGASGVPLLD